MGREHGAAAEEACGEAQWPDGEEERKADEDRKIEVALDNWGTGEEDVDRRLKNCEGTDTKSESDEDNEEVEVEVESAGEEVGTGSDTESEGDEIFVPQTLRHNEAKKEGKLFASLTAVSASPSSMAAPLETSAALDLVSESASMLSLHSAGGVSAHALDGENNRGTGSGGAVPSKLEKNTTLLFDSRFEGGNLSRAFKVGNAEYDLLTMPDINTRAGYSGGHTQWFYFAVSNMRRGIAYTFNIVNLLKDDSLYNRGMRPAMFSTRGFEESKTGWQRVGKRIAYYSNHFETERGTQYHTLTFTVVFPFENDICYFAHCFPYGYSDLEQFLKEVQSRHNASEFMVSALVFTCMKGLVCGRFGETAAQLTCMSLPQRMSTLCTSLTGNKVPLMTITNFNCTREAVASRKAICLSARVHPGETCASWAMQGMLDFLCGPSARAKILRNAFVFKVVPMLNPDGVIAGQYRCSLAGHDLNRQWLSPCARLHPTIHATKSLIKETAARREVVLFCDLHGHSRKCNMFMYGCSPHNPAQALMERVWPFILHKSTPMFKYDDCTFRAEKSKEGSARVVVWKEFSVMNSYTLEMSLGGGHFATNKDVSERTALHYDVTHYLQIGFAMCQAILDLHDPGRVKFNQALGELGALHPQVHRD